MSRDHERRARANDLGRLAQDHLHLPGVALLPGQLHCPGGRLDLGEPHDSPLHLGDRLLCDDDDVAWLEPSGARAGLGQQAAEIVACLELRHALEADHADLGGHVSGGR